MGKETSTLPDLMVNFCVLLNASEYEMWYLIQWVDQDVGQVDSVTVGDWVGLNLILDSANPLGWLMTQFLSFYVGLVWLMTPCIICL